MNTITKQNKVKHVALALTLCEAAKVGEDPKRECQQKSKGLGEAISAGSKGAKEDVIRNWRKGILATSCQKVWPRLWGVDINHPHCALSVFLTNRI